MLSREHEDRRTIDALVAALYDTLSGPAGDRDWDRFRSLFLPGARLIRADHGVEGLTPQLLDVEGFVSAAAGNLAARAFYEREVARRTERFGAIAHVFSTYEASRALDEAPFARGINSIQLFADESGWRVSGLAWDEETPEVAIPPEYLVVRA